MVLLKGLYEKLIALLPKQTKDAAQAWQDLEGEADHAFWMYATPVHMLLGRDSFFLAEPAPMPVSQNESAAIVSSLNQHFSGLGYCFYLLEDIWFLGLDKDPKVNTTPVEKVINQNISSFMPSGEGASTWNQLQNEIQMLLFNHPVNLAREAQGQPVINSLWCHGLEASR
jgi:hypothetical protein